MEKRVMISVDNAINAQAIVSALFNEQLCVECHYDGQYRIEFYAYIVPGYDEEMQMEGL